MVIPITNEDRDKNKCPFLTNGCRCNVYQWRPKICRVYGERTDISEFMRCGFLEGMDHQSIECLNQTLDNLHAQVLLNHEELGFSI